ncbi:transferase [Coniochaeta sp. 2T2.1]|nr:transferase [Coniochaeta sp. 2T2.1]
MISEGIKQQSKAVQLPIMAPTIDVYIAKTERVLPESRAPSERAIPLSLLDATTANFGLTQAIWLFEPPQQVPKDFDPTNHLRKSLQITLSAYPQWCGQCKAVTTPNGPTGEEAKDFPPHARRYGRLYAHFGTSEDPGVEFVTATSSATLDSLYPADRTESQPIWNRRDASLTAFAAQTAIHSTLEPNEPDENDPRKPLLAIQVTTLACGGFVVAAKSAHPIADITALVRLIKDWGSVSRALLLGEAAPTLSPLFEPSLLDSRAAGDINTDVPDQEILKTALGLPMHRYDWWAEGSIDKCPWPVRVPDFFDSNILEPAGDPLPWKDWDLAAPVSSYIIHLSREQVEHLHEEARRNLAGASTRISKHDAVLAHVWSCVVRARQLDRDPEPVHCDLVIGTRPALGLGNDFIGSPTLMVNVELPGATVGAVGGDGAALAPIVRRVRQTIEKASEGPALAAHLHGVAFEKSPQRIWQGFLGRRHIMVTTWARAGIYEVDFGLGSAVRYADGVVPHLDGCILIKEAPPSRQVRVGDGKPAWTDYGVDVSIPLKADDMDRLLKDPLLLPNL